MSNYKFSKDSILLQSINFEILKYFDSISTKENKRWIKKYFKVLIDSENINSEKFNIHHIRPCFTFKDENHKNRKQTQKLANKIEGNLIKLSISNHIISHYYLWKIFKNRDSKMGFQQMCGNINNLNLSEKDLIILSKLQEDCSKKNRTEKEKKEYNKKYNKTYRKTYSEKNKEKIKTSAKKYHIKNLEKIHKRQKKYRKNNKEKISKYQKNYRKNNKNKIKDYQHNYYQNNKFKKQTYYKEHIDEKQKYNKSYWENNKDKIKIKNQQLCYDPIANNNCTLCALTCRKSKHKDKYKNIIPKECIIKS